MKQLIKSIEIKRFRSFDNEVIKTEQLNIFSGKNNSGKSNVLKALNLFFNGYTNYDAPYNHSSDYNKTFVGAAWGKREISIKVNFFGTGVGALKDDFSITKTFGAENNISGPVFESVNEVTQAKIKGDNGHCIGQFTRFLNKIEYIYIPAVRDRIFVRNLLLRLEELIKSRAKNADFDEKIGQLSGILGDVSKGVSESFEAYIGLPAEARLSAKTSDVLGAVGISVKPGTQYKHKKGNIVDVPIDLFSSGDGIIMSYLVYFLAYLTKMSNKNFIWGYEEPENSLEYAKVQKLAYDFYHSFMEYAQIFITSHSPAFIGLRDQPNVALYRVYIQPQATKDIGKLPNHCASKVDTLEDIMSKQLTLFSDKQVLDALNEELHLVEMSQKCEEAARETMQYREQMKQQQKDMERQMGNIFPKKIFICEDERCKTFWEKLLQKYSIGGVEVVSSNGCTNYSLEYWAMEQQRRNNRYSPKIFREVDRDGLSSEQMKTSSDILEKRFGKKMHYKYSVLPVCEVENFTIIDNEEITQKMSETKFSSEVIDAFNKTADNRIRAMIKNCGDHKEGSIFESMKGREADVVRDLKTAALEDVTRMMPGKDLAKLTEYVSLEEKILDADIKFWPEELIEYLDEIKEFFND